MQSNNRTVAGPVNRFEFEVPGKPIAQGSMRDYGHGITHANPDLVAYRETVGWYAKQAQPHGWTTSGPFGVEATFRLPRPKNHYRADGTLKPDAPLWPTRRGMDIDKGARTLLDALQIAGIYNDDSQVIELHTLKRWAVTGPGHLYCTIRHLHERTA